MQVANSQRLQYQLLTDADAQYLFELDQNPEVMRYINGGKPSSMAYIVDEYLPRLKKFTEPSHGWGLWKVSLISSNTFIGWVLIRPMEFFSHTPELDNIEIGWRFKQDAWGKGYATEAARAVRSALLQHNAKSDEVKITKISAVAIEENQGSIAIMKKLGLSYVKTYQDEPPFETLQVVYYQQQVS